MFRYEYLRTSATQLHDGGRHLMMKQRGFQLINPTEKWFPGLSEIRNCFSAWDWCYGKTPKFTVQKEIQLKSDEKDHQVQLRISVNAVNGAMLLLLITLTATTKPKTVIISLLFIFFL